MEHSDRNSASLRGGSLDGVYRPPRFRSLYSGKEQQGREHPQDHFGILPPKGRREPLVLPRGEYNVIAKDALPVRTIELLGIDEDLIRPASPTQSSHERQDMGLRLVSCLNLFEASRSLRELKSETWRPTRLGFRFQWPDEELTAHWYRMVYVHLYLRVAAFAAKYFEHGDIVSNPGRAKGKSVWAEEVFSSQFLYCVSRIARQDNNAGGWDVLLTSSRHRKWLVTGIIGMVLQIGVFDELLFGAEETQQTMFDAQDECTIQLDGRP